MAAVTSHMRCLLAQRLLSNKYLWSVQFPLSIFWAHTSPAACLRHFSVFYNRVWFSKEGISYHSGTVHIVKSQFSTSSQVRTTSTRVQDEDTWVRPFTLNQTFEYLKRKRMYREIISLFQKMKFAGLQPNDRIYQILFTACGVLRADVQVIVRLEQLLSSSSYQPSLYTYNYVLFALCRRKQYVEAKKIFSHMIQQGLQPTAHSYLSFLQAYLEEGDLSSIYKILEEMETKNLIRNIRVYNIRMECCISVGDTDGMLQLYDELKQYSLKPNENTVQIVLKELFKVKQTDRVLAIVDELKEGKLVASPTVFEILIEHLTKLRLYEHVRSLLEFQSNIHSRPTQLALEWTYRFYIRTGDLNAAYHCLKKIDQPSVELYNTFFKACSTRKEPLAITVAGEMLKSSAVPDRNTELYVLEAFANLDRLEEGDSLVKSMKAKHGLLPRTTPSGSVTESK